MKIDNLVFKDRKEAFKMLLEVLPINSMREEEWIVLATSSGGVPIAIDIAKRLNAEFDFLFSQKIYTRKNNKCEVAIITETQDVVIHEELMRSFSLKLENIYHEANDLYLSDIKEYQLQYRERKGLIDLEGKNVLLVDEGLNTGLTMMACIKSVINKKAKSICVAVPVLPYVTINDIETIADDLYFVQAPKHFVAIDFYYEKLEEVTLDTIQDLNRIKNHLLKIDS